MGAPSEPLIVRSVRLLKPLLLLRLLRICCCRTTHAAHRAYGGGPPRPLGAVEGAPHTLNPLLLRALLLLLRRRLLLLLRWSKGGPPWGPPLSWRPPILGGRPLLLRGLLHDG